MIITPTYHSLLRWNERVYNNYTNINLDVARSDMVSDFKDAKVVRLIRDNLTEYQSSKNTFIVEVADEELTIITVYTNESLIEETVDINRSTYGNVSIETRLKFKKEELKLIGSIIRQEDYIPLQILGSKRYVIVDGNILLIRFNRKNHKIFVSIVNRWEISKLYNLDKFKEFEESAKKEFKAKEWKKLLELLQIDEKIHMADEFKKDSLEGEILVYRKVLDGELTRFPNRFWVDDIGGSDKIASRLCVRYLFEDILEWGKYDIYKNFTLKVLRDHKLGGMISVVFDGDHYGLLDNAYPGQLKPWMFKKVKFKSCWREDNNGIPLAKEAIQWMVEESKRDGFVINSSNLLQFDWDFLLEKYNLKEVVSITFDGNYREFFKVIFNVDFSDTDIERFKQHYALGFNNKIVRIHI